MTPFELELRTKIIFGPGRVAALGELARTLGGSRALVVSDPGIVAAGHAETGLQSLRKAGLTCLVFSDVPQSPSSADVEQGLIAANDFQPDLLVGLGGGSSMDCAKGINFVYTNGGRIAEYWGIGKATRPMLPMIAVPTTAGTGSETQSFALISDAVTHVKMACGDKKAACKIALLDPELTVTQPRQVTAVTGIDAVSHALETYVTKARNPASMIWSREAWRLLCGSFSKVLEHPRDLPARSAMQLGAAWAGLAIENSMLGAAHALANPLTAKYGLIHGLAVGLVLPYVIRANAKVCELAYLELAQVAAECGFEVPGKRGSEALITLVQRWQHEAGFQSQLRQVGAKQADLPFLAADAAKQWTGTFNPLMLNEADYLQMYQQAW